MDKLQEKYTRLMTRRDNLRLKIEQMKSQLDDVKFEMEATMRKIQNSKREL